MGIVVLCLVAGAITGLIGSGKGRSGLGWFVIGFLMPLIGLILALVVEPINVLDGSAATPAASLAALKQLAELRASNAITQVEYDQKKQELLARV